MGTDTMEAALERVKQWTLADVMPHLTQPLLIVHSEHDTGFPVADAGAAFTAAGSKDKTLRIFTIEEGGSEHVNADDPDPARQLIADWFAQRLGDQAGGLGRIPRRWANQSAISCRAGSGSSALTCSEPPSSMVKMRSVLSFDPAAVNAAPASATGKPVSCSLCTISSGWVRCGMTSARVHCLTRWRAASMVSVPHAAILCSNAA